MATTLHRVTLTFMRRAAVITMPQATTAAHTSLNMHRIPVLRSRSAPPPSTTARPADVASMRTSASAALATATPSTPSETAARSTSRSRPPPTVSSLPIGRLLIAKVASSLIDDR